MKRSPRRCAECGKLTFATRAQAEEAGYRLQHEHESRFYAYREHDEWHLTTEVQEGLPPQRPKRLRKERRGL